MSFLGFRDGCGGMQPNQVKFEQEKMEGTMKLEGTLDDALWFVLDQRGLGSAFWLAWVIEWVFLFRWDFGGQWAVVAWWAWRRCGGGDWAMEAR